MSRRRRSAGGTSKSNTVGIVLGVALILISASAFSGLTYLYVTRAKAPQRDASSLCPMEGARGVTVILVDTSDDLPRTTKDEALVVIRDVISELPEYHRLDIRVLEISGMKSRSIFSRCNPGDGFGLSEWTANPKLAKERWIKSFEGPAITAIESSLAEAKANNSPIMAAIQDIAIHDFTGAALANAPKRLVIISDMIESTTEYSQYAGRGDLSYERFQHSPAYLKFRTDLRGANLDLWYVTRANVKLDSIGHANFWKRWASDNGSGTFHVVRMQGAQ